MVNLAVCLVSAHGGTPGFGDSQRGPPIMGQRLCQRVSSRETRSVRPLERTVAGSGADGKGTPLLTPASSPGLSPAQSLTPAPPANFAASVVLGGGALRPEGRLDSRPPGGSSFQRALSRPPRPPRRSGAGSYTRGVGKSQAPKTQSFGKCPQAISATAARRDLQASRRLATAGGRFATVGGSPPLRAGGSPRVAGGSPRAAEGSPRVAEGPPRVAGGSPRLAGGSPPRAEDPPLRAEGPPLRAEGSPRVAGGPPLLAGGLPLLASLRENSRSLREGYGSRLLMVGNRRVLPGVVDGRLAFLEIPARRVNFFRSA
jgi:hypothetical protein